jgi:hypothetical protein
MRPAPFSCLLEPGEYEMEKNENRGKCGGEKRKKENEK